MLSTESPIDEQVIATFINEQQVVDDFKIFESIFQTIKNKKIIEIDSDQANDYYMSIGEKIQNYNRIFLQLQLSASKQNTWSESLDTIDITTIESIPLSFTTANGQTLSVAYLINAYQKEDKKECQFGYLADADLAQVIQLLTDLRALLIVIKDTINPIVSQVVKTMMPNPDVTLSFESLAFYKNYKEDNSRSTFFAMKSALQILHYFGMADYIEIPPLAVADDAFLKNETHPYSQNFVTIRTNFLEKFCANSENFKALDFLLQKKNFFDQEKLTQLSKIIFLIRQMSDVVSFCTEYQYFDDAKLIAKNLLQYLEKFFSQAIPEQSKRYHKTQLTNLKYEYLNLTKEMAYIYTWQKNYLVAAIYAAKGRQQADEWFEGDMHINLAKYQLMDNAIAIFHADTINDITTALKFFEKINKQIQISATSKAMLFHLDIATTACEIVIKKLESTKQYRQALDCYEKLLNWVEILSITKHKIKLPDTERLRQKNPNVVDYLFHLPDGKKLERRRDIVKRLALAETPLTIMSQPLSKAADTAKVTKRELTNNSKIPDEQLALVTPLPIVKETNNNHLPNVERGSLSYSTILSTLQKDKRPKSKKYEKIETTTPSKFPVDIPAKVSIHWPLTKHTFNEDTKDVYSLANEPYIPRGIWYAYLDDQKIKLALDHAGSDAKLLEKVKQILSRGLLTKRSQGIEPIDKICLNNQTGYCFKIRFLGEKGDVRIYGFIAEKALGRDGKTANLIIFDLIKLKGHKDYHLSETPKPSSFLQPK